MSLPQAQPIPSPISTENGIPIRIPARVTSFALVWLSSNCSSEITRNTIPITKPRPAPINAGLLNLNYFVLRIFFVVFVL